MVISFAAGGSIFLLGICRFYLIEDEGAVLDEAAAEMACLVVVAEVDEGIQPGLVWLKLGLEIPQELIDD